MVKSGVTRKQLLKEPDQFITFSGKLIAFGQDHLKQILLAVGAFLALILAVTLISQLSIRNENRASEMVENAVAKYATALESGDATTAYQAVKEDFTALFDEYGSKHAARVARITYGDISFKGGDADTAIAMYKAALDDFRQTPAVRNIVLSGLGHATASKGLHTEAIGHFEMLAQAPDRTMKGDALLNLAWLYAAAGETEKSSATYEQLVSEFPNSIYANLVKEKING